jgi:predicted transcriptional regulator of viral defense system
MARPMQRLLGIADEQWGLCTRTQALAAGIAPSSLARLLRDGRLQRVAHGVYRVSGAGELDRLELRAAWLQLDPATPAWERVHSPAVALVSHTSAASLYGVGDLRADVHEFTVPTRRQTRRADVRIHRADATGKQRILLAGLPATRAARMIGDLIGDHVEPPSVARITAEVIDRVFDHPSNVAECLAPYASRFGLRRGDGVGLLDYLLDLADYSERRDVIRAEARGG